MKEISRKRSNTTRAFRVRLGNYARLTRDSKQVSSKSAECLPKLFPIQPAAFWVRLANYARLTPDSKQVSSKSGECLPKLFPILPAAFWVQYELQIMQDWRGILVGIIEIIRKLAKTATTTSFEERHGLWVRVANYARLMRDSNWHHRLLWSRQ